MCGPGKAQRSRRRVGLFPELESGSGGRWKADPTGGARVSERENEGTRGTGWAGRGEMGRRSALGREKKEQASCRKEKKKKRKTGPRAGLKRRKGEEKVFHFLN